MYDIGEHLGEKFLTMELIDGAPLSQVLGVEQGQPIALPISRALPIVIEICAGLQAAHEIGIIHREPVPRVEARLRRCSPSHLRGTVRHSAVFGHRLWLLLVPALAALGFDLTLEHAPQRL